MDVRFWISAQTACTPMMWNDDVAHEAWSKLYLLTSGQARYAVARPDEKPQWIDMRPGFVYLIPGGRRQINTCRATFDLHWCHFTLQDDRLAGRLAALTVIQAFPTDDVRANPQLIANAATDDAAARLRASALIFELLARLPDPIRDPLAAERQRLAPAIAHLEYRFAVPLAIDHLAKLAGLQSSRFNQLFRLVMGTSVHQYQIDLRLAEAKRLLSASDLPISAIAERCGYANAFNFTRLFSMRCGQSPSAYRGARKKTSPKL